MNKKAILIIFCILLPLFLLLFSYKTILFVIDKTPAQQETIDFLQGKENLEMNYSSLEVSHLEDVKGVMSSANYLFYVLWFYENYNL